MDRSSTDVKRCGSAITHLTVQRCTGTRFSAKTVKESAPIGVREFLLG